MVEVGRTWKSPLAGIAAALRLLDRHCGGRALGGRRDVFMGRQRRAAWRDRGGRSAGREQPPGDPGIRPRQPPPEPDQEAGAEEAPLERTVQGHAPQNGENHESTLTQGRRDRKLLRGPAGGRDRAGPAPGLRFELAAPPQWRGPSSRAATWTLRLCVECRGFEGPSSKPASRTPISPSAAWAAASNIVPAQRSRRPTAASGPVDTDAMRCRP